MPERERFGHVADAPPGRGGRFSGPATQEREREESRARRRFTVDALFADTRPRAVGVSDLPNAKEIRLDRIVPDPEQPRRTFDPDKLRELADSIAGEGVLQPIVVRYDLDQDAYVIVHGERRWRASTLAARETIPAIVREVPAERRLIHQLMENIVRDDLNAVDRAAALRALKTQLGEPPWEQVAAAVGIRRSRLFQLLGTEKLPESAREDIRAGRLSEKQSRPLHGLSAARQEALREWIVTNHLSAGESNALARRLKRLPESTPEDAAAARTALAQLTAPMSMEASLGPDGSSTLTMLQAIRDAAAGHPGATAHLRALADRAGAPGFSAAQLDRGIGALAGILARVDLAKALPAAPRRNLTALRDALTALIEQSPSEQHRTPRR